MNRLQTLLLLTVSLLLTSCGRVDVSERLVPPQTQSNTPAEPQPSPTASVAADATAASTDLEPQPLVVDEAPAATPSKPTTDKPIKPKREPIYDTDADAKALIAAATERARLEHKHVLIEWGYNTCGWCYKLHDVFKRDELVWPIVLEEFELVLIDSTSNEELMRDYGGKDRRYSFPHLTILDGAGKVLTNQETGVLEEGSNHVPAKVADFLKKWSPEVQDAEKLLSAALEQAKVEDKKVLIQVGTPYCGWCRVLSRFVDAHKETFSKDYVHLKIDTQRMLHGKEVTERYRPSDKLGVPWMVILDDSGKSLINSLGPQGNTGYPSEPSEIDHFLTMLTTTRNRLTDSDLDGIRKALAEAHEVRTRESRKAAAANR